MSFLAYDVVVPTLGRASLKNLLSALARAVGPLPNRLYLVDDRRERVMPLDFGDAGALAERIVTIAGAARGPAAARNRGWRRASAPWIVFLDDDVVPSERWFEALQHDLERCEPSDGGSQGDVRVPLPTHRRPTDYERNVGRLQGARWITADFAYRREVLESTGGFDERFPRAYREDADLALRTLAAGWTIAQGRRRVEHPVRPASMWISVRLQAGNADDVVMRALHGPDWRERADSPRGRFGRHVATSTCGVVAVVASLAWLGSTLAFAWERIAPGPRDSREVATMLATSAAIPFAAVWHHLRGRRGLRRVLSRVRSLPLAVLFDRDGTLIEDVPGLRDPAGVRPMRHARAALERLRAAGIAIAVVTNQPNLSRGKLTEAELAAIHARCEAMVGPVAGWFVCPHAEDAGCACRKPMPGSVVAALRTLDVPADACVVVGDIGSDLAAADAAGARSVLVPTARTRPEEIRAAPVVARDLAVAVDLILGGRV